MRMKVYATLAIRAGETYVLGSYVIKGKSNDSAMPALIALSYRDACQIALPLVSMKRD